MRSRRPAMLLAIWGLCVGLAFGAAGVAVLFLLPRAYVVAACLGFAWLLDLALAGWMVLRIRRTPGGLPVTRALEGLAGRDFLDIAALKAIELEALLELARDIKKGEWHEHPLQGKFLAMLFQKPSHRTRVSFEVGIARLGGRAVT